MLRVAPGGFPVPAIGGKAVFVSRLEQAGAAGVSVFNRFYQPDIDLETLQIRPQLSLSSVQDTLLRIRWIAMIRPHVGLTLSATGGFHGNWSDDYLDCEYTFYGLLALGHLSLNG